MLVKLRKVRTLGTLGTLGLGAMATLALCALGGFTPYPVMSALTHFPEDFRAKPLLADAAE